MSNSIKDRGGHAGKNNPMYGKIGANKGKKFSNDTKRKMRLAMIKQMQEKYRNNFSPNYSKKAIIYFDKLMKENNININHAENGGEFYIKDLGYWVDGYDKENNVVYEFDELKHYNGDILKQRDLDRQKQIEQFLKCKFIRIKSWKI